LYAVREANQQFASGAKRIPYGRRWWTASRA